MTDGGTSSRDRRNEGDAAETRVTTADIREKLEELQESAVSSATKGGAAWIVGALIGAAAAVGIAYLAGRRACR